MINFENGNLPPCDECNMQKWGVKIDGQGILSAYCTVCSGDYAHTKEARDAAAALLDPNA
jgi:hypothetical protein